jgi:signal transduction histidine kinase
MFHSATLKLTAWYLGILMIISILFSAAIYEINFHEVNVRLENLQNGLSINRTLKVSTGVYINGNDLRQEESEAAAHQMILSLLYINAIIFVAGGLGSYWLARRTLRPIEEAHEAQSRFTSDASHELRTPLAAMKAEIEVSLRGGTISSGEARQLLESNLEEVNKLISLSEMLLNMSRLDYDRLDKKSIDMPALLDEVLKAFPRKRFDVTARKKATAVGDKAALAELMTILIENAIKYSPERSKINIRIFEKMGRFGFEITNKGTIAAKDLEHVFERFYRGDLSRTLSSENGYGLGLALAKKIVEIHAGDIHVFTKGEKVTFTVYLPTLRIVSAKERRDGKITTK